MSLTLRIIIDVLIGAGAFFALAGTVGIIRMPDCFCRMQSSTNIATLGLLLAGLGGIVYSVFVMHSISTAVKIAFIWIIYLISNPAGSHAIAKAAKMRGNETVEMVCDHMGDDLEKEAAQQ